ncbi:PAS domain-containing protein [Kordiimonas aestuarii]|uniref:PAS domain-containing protein n=1 Tax=Kordiimonas aestuarii TaxID=1005925 RepID=UPI0021CF75F2|nr:PAS domain-containing protein [Kordiimonas aestuarii]
MNMSEPQQRMLSHWTKLSMRGGNLPSRADMRLQDIGRYASKIIIIDVKDDPLDYEYRLIGQEVAEELDRDYTGSRFSDVPGKGPGSSFWEHVTQTRDEAKPNFWTELCGIVKAGEKETGILYLPLASDHKTPDKIMLVMHFGRRTLKSHAATGDKYLHM